VQEIINKLKVFKKQAAKIAKLMDAYAETKENPTDNAYILEKKLGDIERTATTLPPSELTQSIAGWLKEEKIVVAKAKDEFRFTFGKELKTLLGKDGRQIRGQYPLLRIGLFTIKLDFEFGNATLFFGPEIEKLKSNIQLQPDAICRELKKFDDMLQNKQFNDEEMLTSIYQAYKRRLALANISYGEKLLITEVLEEFVILKQSKKFSIDPKRENYREYPRITLSYLLYRLRKSHANQQGMRLHVATFDATVDKLRSIWVPENEDGDGTYYSYISFEKTDKSEAPTGSGKENR
jgi:hypothetical protein